MILLSWTAVNSQARIPNLTQVSGLVPCGPWTVVVVQSLSRVWLFEAPWTAARQAPLSFTTAQGLLRFMPTELVMPSNHLILCRPLLLWPFGLFPESQLIEWGGQSTAASASASVLPMTIQGWLVTGAFHGHRTQSFGQRSSLHFPSCWALSLKCLPTEAMRCS